MLDPGLRQTDDRLDGGRREKGVDDDGERWELPAQVLEGFNLHRPTGSRISDDEIDAEVLYRSLQLVPASDRRERVIRSENDSEVRGELTW